MEKNIADGFLQSDALKLYIGFRISITSTDSAMTSIISASDLYAYETQKRQSYRCAPEKSPPFFHGCALQTFGIFRHRAGSPQDMCRRGSTNLQELSAPLPATPSPLLSKRLEFLLGGPAPYMCVSAHLAFQSNLPFRR